MGESTEAVDMKTALRKTDKGGYQASTTFNGTTYKGDGVNEQQAQAALKTIVNKAINAGKFDTNR
jgi:hypothetical protein